MSVDFPTLDLPIKANSGNCCSGHQARVGDERMKEEEEIIVYFKISIKLGIYMSLEFFTFIECIIHDCSNFFIVSLIACLETCIFSENVCTVIKGKEKSIFVI
jgi:hypothetical protein